MQVTGEQYSHAIEELGKFVAIPTVSHPESPYFSMDTLTQGAAFVGSRLEKLGFTVRHVRINESAPFVIAEKIVEVNKPILQLYAHYDVQPVDENHWKSEPFVMEERDGRLYGRGASDDKAGLIAIITALRMYQESGKELPVNIRILSEGEEEYGSSNMPALLKQEAENLHADAMVILDGLNKNVSTGTLTSSTRGIVNLTVKVNALKQPQHSGIACLAPCPAIALAKVISSLVHPEKIPGFMDTRSEMNPEERKIYRECSQTEESYKEEMGMVSGQLRGDPNTSVYERIVETPSISVVNMTAGKPNGGNSIQDKAECTVGIRVTAGQNPEHIGQVVKAHLEAQEVPGNLDLKVEVKETCWAWKANASLPFTQKYLEALAENFHENCVVPCGGALPLLHEFTEAFHDRQIDFIVPGIEDPDTNAHSHNESQSKELLRNTINTLVSFFEKAATV